MTWPPARAELAIDLIYLPSPGLPHISTLAGFCPMLQLLRSCTTWLIRRFDVGAVLSEICLLRLFFWEGPLFCYVRGLARGW